MSQSGFGRFAVLVGCCAGLALAACGADEPSAKPASRPALEPAKVVPAAASTAPPAPADLPMALALGLAQFPPRVPGEAPRPLPSRMEFLVREGGEWKLRFIEDGDSNVFHKVMAYEGSGEPALLTAGGSGAFLKLWMPRPDGSGYSVQTLWEEDFGGKFSRMRDVEVADLYNDGRAAIAVATHDQGVVAIVKPNGEGEFTVDEIHREPDTFVHEIEIGDLDGDGNLEVYATPSEPNRLDGSVQAGRVSRYVPATGEGPVIVADLGDRHAKEIFVDDVDGDGRDELYVVVEGKTKPGSRTELEYKVEIRRYDAETDPKQGVVIAELDDHLCRFLTAGDVDGDGHKEMVAAAFSSGVWLLRPGADPMARWALSSIDHNSGGFEHAAILTDLDSDGRDELYVASDKHKEVRRYVWAGKRMVRETISGRTDGRSIFTWNIMPVPIALVPRADQTAAMNH